MPSQVKGSASSSQNLSALLTQILNILKYSLYLNTLNISKTLNKLKKHILKSGPETRDPRTRVPGPWYPETRDLGAHDLGLWDPGSGTRDPGTRYPGTLGP